MDGVKDYCYIERKKRQVAVAWKRITVKCYHEQQV